MMKSKITPIFIFSLLLSSHVWAQHDPKAFSILESMSEKYRRLKSFEATLSYSMINKSEGINERFTGKISVQGDKFKLILNEQEIINDNKTVWTYMPSENEVVIDKADAKEINPSKFYSLYKTGFKYLYIEEKNIEGELCQVVDLVPEQREAKFFKIRMNIAKQEKNVKSWTLFDRSGTQYLYKIDKFSANKPLADALFTFKTSDHPGVEIVDLR